MRQMDQQHRASGERTNVLSPPLQKSHDLSADYEKARSPSEPLTSFYLLLNSPVVNQSLRPLPCRHLRPEEPPRSREVLHVLDTLCIQLCIENNPEWTGPAHSVQLKDSFYLSATHALLSYDSKLINQLLILKLNACLNELSYFDRMRFGNRLLESGNAQAF